MAEPRKVPCVTVAATDPISCRREGEADASSEPNGLCGSVKMCELVGSDGSDRRPRRLTVRLHLSLSEPSDRRSAEFSYAELLRSCETKKPPERLAPAFQPRDPIADDERETQEMERRKYSNSGKRRRTDRVQDLIDIGFGYDESDSFIDNSEAYDELVPASLNTKLGGFYINTGTLQFRAASDSEGEEAGRGKKGCQKLKGGDERVKKRKRQDGNIAEEKKAKKIKGPKQRGVSLSPHRPEKKKRKQLRDPLSLAAVVRRFSHSRSCGSGAQGNGTPSPALPLQTRPHMDPGSARLSLDPALMSLLHSPNGHQMLHALVGDLDLSPLNCPPPPSSVRGENGLPVSGVPVGQKSCEAALSKGQGPQGLSGGLLAPPPLPSGLPDHLVKRIEDLRVASRQFDEEGRKKFFTLEMNNILLDIELQVQEQPAPKRSAVYSHLEAFVPCSRGALLKRLRKLSHSTQDDQLKIPLLKLKLAVCSAMTQQIARYNMDCVAKVAKQQSGEAERNALEEEDEEKPGRKATGPRKKFIWDDRLRSLLCNLVRVKLACFQLESQGLLSVEDYLKTFLETEVKPLWPKGWMQSRMLLKESRVVHSHLTTSLVKKKKVKPKEGPWNLTPPAVTMHSPAPASCQSNSSPMETICLSDSQDEDFDSASDVHHGHARLSDTPKGGTQSSSLSVTSPLVPVPYPTPKGGAAVAQAHKPNPPGSPSPPKPRPQKTTSPLLPPQQKAFSKPAVKHGLITPSSGQATPSHGVSLPSSGQATPFNGLTLPKPRLTTPSSGQTMPSHGVSLPSSGLAAPFNGLTLPKPGLTTPPGPVKSSNKSSYGSSNASNIVSPQPRLGGLAPHHLNPKGPLLLKMPHSSSLHKAAPTATLTSSPSPPKQSLHQSNKPNLITPMQVTLAKSSHSNNQANVKLSSRLPAPQAGHVAAEQSGYGPAGIQNTPTHGGILANASPARTVPVSSQVISSSAPAVGSTNHGQHMRTGGGASQTAKPNVSLTPVAGLSTPITSHFSQGSSTGGALPGATSPSVPLGLGVLGSLVPVSLPFQFPASLLSLATAGSSTGSSGTALGGSSGYAATQNVSPTQGGETKRNLH